MGINTRQVLTELQSLNTMCSYVGIPPLLSLSEINSSSDHLSAQLVQNEVIEQVCARGLPCNTDYNYTLSPETDGTILVPEGAISVLTEGTYMEYIVERDGKLYDTRNKTFNINKDIDVTVYWLLDFESLPQVVRKYITINSARRYVARYKGDDAVLNTTIDDERRAEAEYLRYVEQTSTVNMIYDNPEMSYIADRSVSHYGRY